MEGESCSNESVAAVSDRPLIALHRVPAWSAWVAVAFFGFNGISWVLNPTADDSVGSMLNRAIAETAGLATAPQAPGAAAAAAAAASAAGTAAGTSWGQSVQRIASTVVTVTLAALYAWGGLYPRIAHVGSAIFAVYALATVAIILVVYGCELALAATAPEQPDTPGQRRAAKRALWLAGIMYAPAPLARGAR